MSNPTTKRAIRGAIGYIRLGVSGGRESRTVTFNVPAMTTAEKAIMLHAMEYEATAIARGLQTFQVIVPHLFEGVDRGHERAVAVLGNLLLDQPGTRCLAFIEGGRLRAHLGANHGLEAKGLRDMVRQGDAGHGGRGDRCSDRGARVRRVQGASHLRGCVVGA